MELPPILDRKFAPEENRYINHIDNKLSELQRHEDDFGSCLLLLDHIEQLAWAVEARTPRGFPRPDSLREEYDRLTRWISIPANQSTLVIYHFQAALRSIRDQLGFAPKLRAKVDTKKLELAYQRFLAEFPHWKLIRDWVGHVADRSFTPEQVEEQFGDGGLVLQGCLFGRTLTFTTKGEFLKFDVIPENLEKLRSIKRDVWAAFQRAALQPI